MRERPGKRLAVRATWPAVAVLMLLASMATASSGVPSWGGGFEEARFVLSYPAEECYREDGIVIPILFPEACIDHTGSRWVSNPVRVELRDDSGFPVAAQLIFEDAQGEPVGEYYPAFCGHDIVWAPQGWARLRIIQDVLATCAPLPGVMTEGDVIVTFNPPT